MTFKKPTGAGLLALALGALFALFLNLSVIDHSYAEEAAAAPVADSAPLACAGNPDPRFAVLENCAPNSGDTAWMLTSVALVNSGVAGLMACLVLGKRKDTGPNHNMVL